MSKKLRDSREWTERHWLQEMINEDLTQPIQKLPNDSVDAAIDEQLIGATKTLSKGPQQPGANESRKRKGLSLRELLEADDEKSPKDDGPPLPDAPQAAGEPSPQQQSVDTNAMSREVARIVQNATGLIDLEGTVLRRSLNYVGVTYGADAMESVKRTLETNYSIYTEREEDRDENEPDMAAKGAGPEIG